MRDNLDLVAIGDSCICLTFASTPFNVTYGTEIVVPDLELEVAGSSVLCAQAASRLGLKTSVATRLGDDYYGTLVLSKLKKLGIDTSLSKTHVGERTSVSAVILHRKGDRAIVTYLGTQARFCLTDLCSCLENLETMRPKVVHFGGYFLLPLLQGKPAKRILKTAQENGAMTSLDPGWDPECWRKERIEDLKMVLRYVDVFFPNIDEARKISCCEEIEEAAEYILSLGPNLVVVKLGSEGCYVLSESERIMVPAFDVKVVDTNAAGDSFDAGFIYGLVKGFDLRRIAVCANAVGALKTTHFGLDFSFLSKDLLEQFLSSEVM